MKKIITVIALLNGFLSFAQQNNAVEMADALYSNGKIYVVVVVLVVIFIGIVAYLIQLDRKISKIEKEIKQ